MSAGRAGVLLATLVLACGDAETHADSTMARDLALANQSPPLEPELKDTVIGRPVTPPAPAPRGTPVARGDVPRGDVPRRETAPAPADTATAPQPLTQLPPPGEPARAESRFRGLPAGTAIRLTTKSQLCTTNLPGDKITATVTSDVAGENGAVIPAGSTVVLELAEAAPGDSPDNARLRVRIRSVFVNDQPLAVPSEIAVDSGLERRTLPRDKGADRRKVVGGAVAGAVIGQVMGKDTKSTVTGAVVGAAAGAGAAAASTKYDACLNAGSTLTATTTQAIPIAG